MSVVAVIPARMGSTRLPAKVLTDIHGVPLVVHVAQRVRESNRVDRLLVATDSHAVANVVRDFGIDVYMSKRSHATGSDRVSEAVAQIDAKVVLNVQADNGDLSPQTVDAVVSCLDVPTVQVATPVCPFPVHLGARDRSRVKVAIDEKNCARYFSRAPIPHNGPWWLHVGVYGFRPSVLQRFAQWDRGALEIAEDLEQLRFIENGVPIRVTHVAHAGVSVDTHADLSRLVDSPSSNEQPPSRF